MKLLTKSYVKDIGWLELAIISVMRNCQCDIDWTIVCDRGESGRFLRMRDETARFSTGKISVKISVHEIQDLWPESAELGGGYIQQQWVKMNAHKAMGEGYFLNWDSDVVALRPFDESDFRNELNKPILWFTPFNDLIMGGDAIVHQKRREYIRNIFHIPDAPFEWMRCMPIWMNGEILKVGASRGEWERARILMKSGAVEGLSEFNLIGQMSNMFFPDTYDYKNTQTSKPTWAGPLNGAHNIVCQSWSWGGVISEVRDFVMKGL